MAAQPLVGCVIWSLVGYFTIYITSNVVVGFGGVEDCWVKSIRSFGVRKRK